MDLLEVLAGLCACHGDHPVLLETQADFADDDRKQLILYQRAIEIAVAHGLPTLSIQLSLTGLLVESGQRPAALRELLACERGGV